MLLEQRSWQLDLLPHSATFQLGMEMKVSKCGMKDWLFVHNLADRDKNRLASAELLERTIILNKREDDVKTMNVDICARASVHSANQWWCYWVGISTTNSTFSRTTKQKNAKCGKGSREETTTSNRKQKDKQDSKNLPKSPGDGLNMCQQAVNGFIRRKRPRLTMYLVRTAHCSMG